MTIDLNAKVAIVTGAGKGIGREIATMLAQEGVKTVVADINQEDLDKVGQEFESKKWEGLQQICDVRNTNHIQSVVDSALAKYGKIDILVNNAGVAAGDLVETLTEEIWDANIDVNLKGTFLMCQAVIPVMKKQGSGRIINASSFAAVIPRTGTAAYASSKAGVVYFTRVLAGELGPWNITVNCYAPGMIPTDMNNYDKQPEPKQQELLDMLTLRRWGAKTDIGNLICFLASELAGYITGTLINVSGGKLVTQMPGEAYSFGQEVGR